MFWGDCPTGRLRKEEKTCLLRGSILEIELLGLLEKSPVIWESELDKKTLFLSYTSAACRHPLTSPSIIVMAELDQFIGPVLLPSD